MYLFSLTKVLWPCMCVYCSIGDFCKGGLQRSVFCCDIRILWWSIDVYEMCCCLLGDLFELSIGRSTSQIFCPFCVQCGIACSSDHFKVGPGSLVLLRFVLSLSL